MTVADAADATIIQDAISKHPDCKYGKVENGLTPFLQLTRVVLLWLDEHSWQVGNKPKYEVQGYLKKRR